MKKNIKSSIIDPVHGNIPVTELEYSIIDTREFQRLRHILQNSTAYQTYPSNTNTRFPHSLGVMHIAGKMFLNALSNTDAKTLRCFLDTLNTKISNIREKLSRNNPDSDFSVAKLEKIFKEEWLDKPPFGHRPRTGDEVIDLRGYKESKHSDHFLICTAYEAIRIGALVHDIGHMPLSHIFEQAATEASPFWDSVSQGQDKSNTVSERVNKEMTSRIEAYKNSLDQTQKDQVSSIIGKTREFEFHELRGLIVFQNICNVVLKNNDIYDSLATSITQEILLSLPPNQCQEEHLAKDNKDGTIEQNDFYNFFGSLHSFFANDFVDADRLDYTLRDPISSGIKFSEINVELLYENIFIQEKSQPDDVNNFCIIWHSKAIPSIEIFFHQRYLGYKFIAFNHSVMRTNAIAKEIIAGILHYNFNQGNFKEIANISEKMDLYLDNKEEGQQLFTDETVIDFDDAWFRTLFVLIFGELKKKPNKVKKDKNLQYLQLLLDTYIHRKSANNLFTLWKSESDFDNWHNSLFEKVCGDNTENVQKLKEKVLDDDEIEFFSKFKDDIKPIILKSLNSNKNTKSIKLILERKQVKIFNKSKDDYPVFDIFSPHRQQDKPSPYMTSFMEVDKLSPDFSLFLVGDSLRDKRNKECSLNEAKLAIENSYLSYLELELSKI
ncbi:MAG: hypothetical protein PSN34_01055 [Urechidicola sp.]|nr:hypothetical protein [Urechidicola sp.]